MDATTLWKCFSLLPPRECGGCLLRRGGLPGIGRGSLNGTKYAGGVHSGKFVPIGGILFGIVALQNRDANLRYLKPLVTRSLWESVASQRWNSFCSVMWYPTALGAIIIA